VIPDRRSTSGSSTSGPPEEAVGTPVKAPERVTLRWVRQEDPEGCALAVLAMLTGDSYAEVKAEIEGQDFHGHNGDWSTRGLTHISIDRHLASRGFYEQRAYEAWGLSAWPPDPWAPIHYAQVVQPSGNAHFIVMDAAGSVLDPLREGTFKLTDWQKVNNVVGLVVPAHHTVPRPWTCEHGTTYNGSEDFISGARNAHSEYAGREQAREGDQRSVNDIAQDIIDKVPEAEPLVEEWFAATTARLNELAVLRHASVPRELARERQAIVESLDRIRQGFPRGSNAAARIATAQRALEQSVDRELAVELAEAARSLLAVGWPAGLVRGPEAARKAADWSEASKAVRRALQQSEAQSSGLLEPEETGP
jgi:hypothetical protein